MRKKKLRRLLAESYERHDNVEAEYQAQMTDNASLVGVLATVRRDYADVVRIHNADQDAAAALQADYDELRARTPDVQFGDTPVTYSGYPNGTGGCWGEVQDGKGKVLQSGRVESYRISAPRHEISDEIREWAGIPTQQPAKVNVKFFDDRPMYALDRVEGEVLVLRFPVRS